MTTKPHKQALIDALQVQNACNLSGVLHSLLGHIAALREEGKGTADIRADSVVVLFVAKAADLCGISCDWDRWPIDVAYTHAKAAEQIDQNRKALLAGQRCEEHGK